MTKADGVRPVNSPRAERLAVAMLIVLVGTALLTGFVGIDYGPHWDEGYVTEELSRSYRNGLFLPRRYNYPSVTYDIALAGSLPYLAVRASQLAGQMNIGWGAAFLQARASIDSHDFLLYTRAVFLLLSAGLTPLWTFLLIRSWGRGRWEALLGAAILASSWELAYHARWIAPDAILMQFGVLAMWLTFEALRAASENRGAWLMAAAASAALACGSKYFGGIFLLPVLAAAMWERQTANERNAKRRIALVLLVFAAAFLISTPGAFVEPAAFFTDVRREVMHYQAGHYGNTVAPITQHGWLLAAYLGFVSFSHFAPISLLFSGLAIHGAVGLIRETQSPPQSRMFLLLPLLFAAYMSLQRVMIARNYLLLLPFLAVLAARGSASLLQRIRPANFRIAGVAALAGLLLVNLAWLARSAISIANSGTIDRAEAIVAHLLRYSGTAFCLSEPVSQLSPPGFDASNVHDETMVSTDCQYMLSTDEIPLTEQNGAKWLANRPGRYHLVAGSYNLNFDYYPWWPGPPKIVALDAADAVEVGLLVFDDSR